MYIFQATYSHKHSAIGPKNIINGRVYYELILILYILNYIVQSGTHIIIIYSKLARAYHVLLYVWTFRNCYSSMDQTSLYNSILTYYRQLTTWEFKIIFSSHMDVSLFRKKW